MRGLLVSPTSFAKANCAVPAVDGPMLNRDSLTPIYPASLSDCLIQTDPLSGARLTRLPHPGAYVPAVSQGYLSRKLSRPLPTKDGGTLRTVLDARAYMLRRIGSEAPGGKGQPNYSLRRPMSALSAGNSNSRCCMTASSTLGRWHENPNALHLPRRYLDT